MERAQNSEVYGSSDRSVPVNGTAGATVDQIENCVRVIDSASAKRLLNSKVHGCSDSSVSASGTANATVDQIENCVRVIGKASARSVLDLPSGEHKSAAASVAFCALTVFLCIILAGSQLYNKFCVRAADALPNNVDVLFAGSSVAAVPFMRYEFPNEHTSLLLDRFPILETPKIERLLASCGAPNLSVYNSSAVGQSIEETEEFVKDFVALDKHPRLLVLFVFPAAVVGSDPSQTRSLLPEEVEQLLLRWQHNFSEFHSKVQRQISHLASAIYDWKLHLKKRPSEFGEPFHGFYRQHYREPLSERRLGVIAHILDMCKSHSIRTLVVSTPLASNNRALMSAFSYEQYARTMRNTVRRSQGDESFQEDEGFVDLGTSPEFIEGSDFQDGVHCNANGGEKILREIAPRLIQALQ